VDIVAPDGDGAHTFKSPRRPMFVATAAEETPVASTGNRSVSCKSGSPDVLESWRQHHAQARQVGACIEGDPVWLHVSAPNHHRR